MDKDPLGELVREKLRRYPPPSGLEDRIRNRLREEAGGPAPARRNILPLGPWIVAAGALAAALAVGFFWGQRRAEGFAFARELVSDQARAQQGNHLIEVASSDRHTVKPWLSARLDFSPPVADLSAEGYPLDGARLERIQGKPAAALVYRRSLHVITVFVWASDESPPTRASRLLGYAALAWRRDGLNYAVVSDIPSGDLEVFAAKLREAIH
jgi:anti-sigma factor RsiW